MPRRIIDRESVVPASLNRRLRVPLTPPQAVPHTSAVLWSPQADAGRFGLVLGHGAGTDLTNAVLRAAGRGLADRGYPVLTFNFPYAEAGRKRPDPLARLESAFHDAVSAATEAMAARPLVLGGRSMGGRIASRLAAQGQPCAGLVLLNYPLHSAKSRRTTTEAVHSERLRTDHWPDLSVPVLFVQGDRDPLCDLEVLDSERRAHLGEDAAQVHVVAGADHAFAVRKTDGRDPAAVLDEVVEVVADWLDELPVDRVVAG